MAATKTKEEVNYRVSSSIEKRCGTCSMFLSNFSCTLVKGLILPYDVCDEYDPK